MFHLEINGKKNKNYNYLNRYESTFKDIPFCREKARVDNFFITGSVSLLNVELRKKR